MAKPHLNKSIRELISSANNSQGLPNRLSHDLSPRSCKIRDALAPSTIKLSADASMQKTSEKYVTNRLKIGQQTPSRAHMCLHYFVKSSAANKARFELERNRNPIINACCGRQISAKIDFSTIKMDELLFFFLADPRS